MSKHTPGPWRDVNMGEQIVIIAPVPTAIYDYYLVATVSKGDHADANARLIAAAPELLEALVEISHALADGSLKFTRPRQSDSDPYHKANVLMCAAIEKATA